MTLTASDARDRRCSFAVVKHMLEIEVNAKKQPN